VGFLVGFVGFADISGRLNGSNQKIYAAPRSYFQWLLGASMVAFGGLKGIWKVLMAHLVASKRLHKLPTNTA